MLETLMEEYKKELDAFKEFKECKERHIKWQNENPDKNPWDYDELCPNPNRANLKRLGIMIRAEMIEIERHI